MIENDNYIIYNNLKGGNITKYSVIVSDDDSFICKGICKTIEQLVPNAAIQGVFNTGNDVMKFLETHRVDVVISDIKMHGYTGLEIAKYVKNKNPQTFVILVTGHLLFEYAKEAIDSKVDYFLTKPFSSDEFLKIMNEIEDKISNNIELTRLNAQTYLNRWEYLTNISSRKIGRAHV